MADLPSQFTRDRSLAAEVADSFGGTAGNAEQLIEANALRFSPDLEAAQLLPAESSLPEEDRRDLSFETQDVAKAAGLDEESVKSHDIHGDYVVFAYETPADGRIHKEALKIDDGSLVATGDTPQRAAVRAQIEAATKVNKAQADADEIIKKAEADAQKILADAAQKAEEGRAGVVAAAREGETKAKAKPKAKNAAKK